MPTLTELLLREVLDDVHRYAPGIDPLRPTVVAGSPTGWRQALRLGREHVRDRLERAASRAGFSHRHFDPQVAAAQLARLVELSGGLEQTFSALADEHSRRLLLDLLKLRVLGPFHAPLQVTAQMFRSRQLDAERRLRLRHPTFEVSDPWFSPLSLFRVPAADGTSITVHTHSVEVVSLFGLGQYSYRRGATRVCAEPGETVFDVGGCWGDTALYMASLVGPRGKVYTFEFDPESLVVLRANLELNPHLASRIEVVEQALWSESHVKLGFAQGGRMTRLLDEPHDGGLQVETITLDEFVKQAQVNRLDFVKMDVEGAERGVLSGARESLQRLAPKLAIAAYHREDDLVQLPRAVFSSNAGFRLYLDTYSPLEEETVLFAAPPS